MVPNLYLEPSPYNMTVPQCSSNLNRCNLPGLVLLLKQLFNLNPDINTADPDLIKTAHFIF